MCTSVQKNVNIAKYNAYKVKWSKKTDFLINSDAKTVFTKNLCPQISATKN